MRLTSPVFVEGGQIPRQYSGEGCNELPPLDIEGVPAETTTLAVVMEDLDSPLGDSVTHWLVWNLPPETARLDATHLPDQARQGTDSFGRVGYRGPNPPEGRHHYRFRLLALDMHLALERGATRTSFDHAIRDHVLAEADLTGYFEDGMDEAPSD